jgi:uncharacterized protein (TIGR00369 family)
MTDNVPEGFVRNTRPSPVTDVWEPLYEKVTPDAIVIGLHLREAHTNRRGLIHGGVIAALADKAMGHSCGHKMGAAGRPSLVTVNLSLDYISTAKIGQWLTVESDVIKMGKTLCFTQCMVKADGEVIARGNASFRVVPRTDEGKTA